MLRLHRLLIVFLLAWLPLQAAALPMLALHCESGHLPHEVADGHQGHAAAQDRAPLIHDGQEDDGMLHQHLCCHHLYALPVTEAREPGRAAFVPLQRLARPLFSFFPEPQRRPPRA